MARSWPVQPREGFTAVPNAILARALAELTPEQFRLFVGLVYVAEWRPEGGTSPDGRWRIERGQVLASYDGLAARYGMNWQAVRRALRRLEQLGFATTRRASPAGVSADTPPDTQADTLTGTHPTLVDLGSWFGIQPPAEMPDTQADTPPDMSADPIQQEKTRTPNTEKPSPAPAAPARAVARRKEKGGEPDPRHRPLQQRLEASFLELRGSAYGFAPRDARAITDLLRLSSGDQDEVDRRWRVGLSENGFRRCDTIHELAAVKWNAYVAPRESAGRRTPWRGDLGVEHGGEWWRRLSSAEREHFLDERKALDPELDGAPFPALGVAAPRQVEELIARYRGEAEQPGAAAGGAR